MARLATIGAGGEPHIVPITFAVVGETLYWSVDAKPKTTTKLKRLTNIRRDGRVSVLVDHYDDDWSKLWWCRLDGNARIVERPDEAATALSALTYKYRQYANDVPSGAVVAVDVLAWQGWAWSLG